ncbi:MAG TPA: hypothetical protein IGS40_20915 [Trichormus sp. M33_DOE_039]|nr:hypothetical protein [Trichormus sp. M33_DOE_039]
MRWGDTALGWQCPTCSKCRWVSLLIATAVIGEGTGKAGEEPSYDLCLPSPS